MASPVIATFLSLTLRLAQAADERFGSERLIAVTDNSGRPVWVNESRVSRRHAGAASRQGLVHGSSAQHRYQAVTRCGRGSVLYNGGSSSDWHFSGASRRPVRAQRDEPGSLCLSNTDNHRPLVPGRRQSGSTSMAGAEQCRLGQEPEWKQNGESPA
jgi:hypothetical protein